MRQPNKVLNGTKSAINLISILMIEAKKIINLCILYRKIKIKRKRRKMNKMKMKKIMKASLVFLMMMKICLKTMIL
jgi:hypothetical protein